MTTPLSTNTVLYEQILSGSQPYLTLNAESFTQFQAFCSAQSLPLSKWLQLSTIIFQSNKDQCLQFLQYLDKHEINKPIYNDFIHQNAKIKVYTNLFSLLLAKASKEKQKQLIDKYLLEAKRYLSSGEKVKMMVKGGVLIGRALLSYYDGEFSQATNSFNHAVQDRTEIQTDPSEAQYNLIGLIQLAQISFFKRKYQKALDLYKKALSTYKSLPIKARLGMGYCFYFLEKYEMATACFKRVLRLDPECIEAFIGLACIEAKNENIPEYFKLLTLAYKLDKTNPLVLLHLSEHFLIKNDIEKAKKLAQTGLNQILHQPKFLKFKSSGDSLIRNDYEQLKARINNILGQIDHIKGNFIDAQKYYKMASQKGLIFNDIQLSQIYAYPLCQDYKKSLAIIESVMEKASKLEQKLLNQSLKEIGYFKSKIPTKDNEQKAIESYNDAIKYNKNDVQVKIQLASLLSQTNKPWALKLLLSANKILASQEVKDVKVELTNNIGVSYIQNGELKAGEKYLIEAVSKAEKILAASKQMESQEQSIKAESNYLISLFNLALVKDKLCLFDLAAEYYQKIIDRSQYFIDAYIRLAYLQFQQGNYQKSIATLDKALSLSENQKVKFVRFDKAMSMKVAITKQWGNSSSAKQILKQLSKNRDNRDVYTQIYELSIAYENIIKRQVQTTVMKDFLRPNRQSYFKFCHDQPHSAFGYLVLAVLLLTDRRLTLNQGKQLFTQLKQHASDQMPIILYNMGLFFLNYDDYESSKYSLNAYKEKRFSDPRANQLTALGQLLSGHHEKSLSGVKRNIMMDPSNLKYRYQMAYVLEKKCQRQPNQDKRKPNANLLKNLKILKKCYNLYNYFSKAIFNEYVKLYKSPDHKELLKSQLDRIRNISQERKFYVTSNIEYFDKFQKELQEKLRQQQEWKQRNLQKLRAIQQKENCQHIANSEEDQEDSEEIARRKKQDRKRKALQIAKRKEQEVTEKWEQVMEKEKQLNLHKPKKTRQPRDKSYKKRDKKAKEEESEQIKSQSERSFQDELAPNSQSQADSFIQDDIAPKRSRRQEPGRDKKHKKRIKISPKNSDNSEQNPFSDSYEDEDDEGDSGRKDKKRSKQEKKKKEEEQEDMGIDMNEYMIN